MAIAKSGPAGVITTGPVVGQTQLGQDITIQSVKNTLGAEAQSFLDLQAQREREAAEAEANKEPLGNQKMLQVIATQKASGMGQHKPRTLTAHQLSVRRIHQLLHLRVLAVISMPLMLPMVT